MVTIGTISSAREGTRRSFRGVRGRDGLYVEPLFDDTVASLPTYNLTTIRQPVARMVDSALRVLFERIEKRTEEPEHVLLGAQFIERGTVSLRPTPLMSPKQMALA